jgi:hypothetical protein
MAAWHNIERQRDSNQEQQGRDEAGEIHGGACSERLEHDAVEALRHIEDLVFAGQNVLEPAKHGSPRSLSWNYHNHCIGW